MLPVFAYCIVQYLPLESWGDWPCQNHSRVLAQGPVERKRAKSQVANTILMPVKLTKTIAVRTSFLHLLV